MRLPSDLVYTMRRYATKDLRPKIGGCETGREGELYKYNLLCPGKSIAHYFWGLRDILRRVDIPIWMRMLK